jgi:hypothetical protein
MICRIEFWDQQERFASLLKEGSVYRFSKLVMKMGRDSVLEAKCSSEHDISLVEEVLASDPDYEELIRCDPLSISLNSNSNLFISVAEL